MAERVAYVLEELRRHDRIRFTIVGVVCGIIAGGFLAAELSGAQALQLIGQAFNRVGGAVILAVTILFTSIVVLYTTAIFRQIEADAGVKKAIESARIRLRRTSMLGHALLDDDLEIN